MRWCLWEVSWRPCIAWDPRAVDTRCILVDDVRTLIHRLFAGKTQTRVQSLNIYVDKLEPGTRHFRPTVYRCDHVVLGCSREVLPGDIGDLEGGRVADSRITAVDALGDIDRQRNLVQAEIPESYVLCPAASTSSVIPVGVCRCWHTLPRLDPSSIVRID